MRFYFLLLILMSSTMAFAQIHTNPGGGGFRGPPTIEEECHYLDTEVTRREKSFVRSFKKKYLSEDDFTGLLEQIYISETVKNLENPKQLGRSKLSCGAESIKALKEILELLKAGTSKERKCKQFDKRLKQVDLLEKVIQLHENK